jgi:hypothetical protein
MSFQRSCLYNSKEGMRVIEEDQEEEYKRLLDTGVWFDHPNKVNEKREDYEKPIRQHARKRRVNGEDETKSI